MSSHKLLHDTLEHVLTYEEATQGLMDTTCLCIAQSKALTDESARMLSSLGKVVALRARTEGLQNRAQALAAAMDKK